jgi:hypothetical protein
MDGDGSILNFVHRPTVKKYPNYVYERLWVCFHSASKPTSSGYARDFVWSREPTAMSK